MKLEFVTVFSEAEFLQRQTVGKLNSRLSYKEYLHGCEETNALVKRQREAMKPDDRRLLEEREADFRNRQQKQPLAA